MSDDQIEISIVSPVYKAEALVGPLVAQLREVLGGITRKFEIILVEDGCPEGSWEAIERSCKDSPEVLGLKLSRNFGQHYAISAGLNRTRGKWVVVMDCDLQDLPSEIPALLAKAKEGHDIVLARRAVRQDSWLKRLRLKGFLQFAQLPHRHHTRSRHRQLRRVRAQSHRSDQCDAGDYPVFPNDGAVGRFPDDHIGRSTCKPTSGTHLVQPAQARGSRVGHLLGVFG
ncbi:MAG: glycosyltransferase family 2 protein [Flavobacteriales bacterium]|nr:glycosyltransferase family 2 protein [Flavobacteriales bacterium]